MSGYINQFLIGWNVTPQNIKTDYVREIPVGHNLKQWAIPEKVGE